MVRLVRKEEVEPVSVIVKNGPPGLGGRLNRGVEKR